MTNVDVLEQALKLPSNERFIVLEGLLKSLDVPDPEIDQIWSEEAEKRLAAYRNGDLRGIPIEEVFADGNE